jgi:hypothetical protein
MPVWLMFIPVVAIAQGIIVLIVALGQWMTGTYYALAPEDGQRGGHVEIVRAQGHDGPMRIEATLADGRTYVATFQSGERRRIVRDGPPRYRRGSKPAVNIQLYAADGTVLDCYFTQSRAGTTESGRCAAADGRGFAIIAADTDTTAHEPRG